MNIARSKERKAKDPSKRGSRFSGQDRFSDSYRQEDSIDRKAKKVKLSFNKKGAKEKIKMKLAKVRNMNGMQ